MSLRCRQTLPLALALAGLLAGCGAGGREQVRSSASTPAAMPAYVRTPYTPQQLRVEHGGHLFVVDGCSACHAINGRAGIGPSFAQFAGERVRLADGRPALVNEQFLREALLNPRSVALAGYPPQPMLAAVTRLHFREHPAAVAALAAFIEQIGPEDESPEASAQSPEANSPSAPG